MAELFFFTTAAQVVACRDCVGPLTRETAKITGVNERGYWALCSGCAATVVAKRGGRHRE